MSEKRKGAICPFCRKNMLAANVRVDLYAAQRIEDLEQTLAITEASLTQAKEKIKVLEETIETWGKP